MSIEKAQIKVLVSQNIGKELEGEHDKLEQILHQKKGAVEALKFAAKRISELNEITDKEFKEGKLDDILSSPLELAKFIKVKVTQAVHCVDNLATASEIGFYKTQGEIDGLKKSIMRVKKIYDEENGKLIAIKRAEELANFDEVGPSAEKNNLLGPKPPGVHPGPSLKHIRQMEEAKKSPKKKKEQKPKTKKTAARKPKAKKETKNAKNS